MVFVLKERKLYGFQQNYRSRTHTQGELEVVRDKKVSVKQFPHAKRGEKVKKWKRRQDSAARCLP